jgi:hypothetical protein
MRICDVVEILPKRRKKDEQKYIVAAIDTGKQLYADEERLIDLNQHAQDWDASPC